MAADLSMQIAIGAALSGSFAGAFSKAGNIVGDAQKRIEALSKTAGKIESHQKLQQRIVANQAAMLAMRKEAGALASSSLPEVQKQAAALSSKAETLQKRLDKDRDALSRLRPELAAAGVYTKNLASEHARLPEK